MMVSNPAWLLGSPIDSIDLAFFFTIGFTFAQAQIIIEIRYSDANLFETVPFEGDGNKGPLRICYTRPVGNPGVGRR